MTLATSRALVASEVATPWEEGLAPPAAAAGSGRLRLELGVGRLPAVQLLARALSSLPDRYREDYAADLLAALAPAAMLAPYAVNPLTLTLILTLTLALALTLTLTLALPRYGLPPPAGTDLGALSARLQALTTAGSGLLYSRAAARGALGVSLQLNAFALLLVRRLRLAGAL